ncbi:MAG: hypothetical protein N0E44_06995 [Candidatus Thiodiazotropha lotti]|nr:hypothetical protein [Candidatus Thiodiazotropha lotti]MCW4219629.1 hypothetical protein [Candidatus Thiodiazotropha lotti]
MEIEKSIGPTEPVTFAVHQIAGIADQNRKFSAQIREFISRIDIQNILYTIQYCKTSHACEVGRFQNHELYGPRLTVDAIAPKRLEQVVYNESMCIDLVARLPLGESGTSSNVVEKTPGSKSSMATQTGVGIYIYKLFNMLMEVKIDFFWIREKKRGVIIRYMCRPHNTFYEPSI